jgi:glutamine synthetase
MRETFTYRRGGVNAYRGKPGDWRPSSLGLHAIGGIIGHLPALTAIGCSTVNSYRRMLDLGLWAPVFADWGLQNRTCALRVSSPERLEYRSVDSMVNPYLMCAALLVAMDDGLKNKIDPGEPEQRNVYEVERQGKPVKRLPTTLGDALRALEQDEVVRRALPGDMYRVYMHCKIDEWERYCATVTEWDIKTYIDCLP